MPREIGGTTLGVGIILLLAGCPKPPPNPVIPTTIDAAVAAIDAPPANCAEFSGKYSVVDTQVSGSPSCSKSTKDTIHVEVPGKPDPDSNQWDVSIYTSSGQQLLGLVKQVEDRPYVCRFVVDFQGDLIGVVAFNRDFYLGEKKNIGAGEASVREGTCVWKSVSTLTLIP